MASKVSTRMGSRLKWASVAAGALALGAFFNWRSAKRAEQRFPPRGKFVDIDGVRLHYLEQGSGPSVVLLHGNGSTAEDFVASGLWDELASRYHVVAFDRPGFGYSERPRDRRWSPAAQAELLHKACAMLGIRRPIVIAHSFGTLVALTLALEAPTLVRGLVLISGYYFPTLRLDALLLSPPAIPVLGDLLRYTVSPLLGRLLLPGMLEKVFWPRPIDRRFVDRVPPGLMLRPWQLKAGAEESAMMVPAAARLKWRYGLLSAPVEIFAGTEDRLANQEAQSARLHRELPSSRLHWIASEGHMLHYRAAAQIGDAVDRIVANQDLPREDIPAPVLAETLRQPARR